MPQAIKSITCHNPVRAAGGGVKQCFSMADGYAITLLDNRVFAVTNNNHAEYRRCIPMENVYEFQDCEEASQSQAPQSNEPRGKRA